MLRAVSTKSGSLAHSGAARLRSHVAAPALQVLPIHLSSNLDSDDDESDLRRRQHLPHISIRQYSTTPAQPYRATSALERSGPALALGLGSMALAAKAAQLSVRAYKEWKESQPEEEKVEVKDEAEQAKANVKDDGAKKKDGGAAEGKRENFFAKFFGAGVGSKYYEGGFEDTMTKREAALVLGVRESSTTKRIKDAHRKLLILNHPDTGGSTYLAGKLNEAKELLLKGRRDN